MDSLYLLLPLSVLLVLALIGLFAWALHGGQFDDLEREGWRVLDGAEPVVWPPPAEKQGAILPTLDPAQESSARPSQQSGRPS
jgi:cbb3-type cytochrome oxidase maturation protein